MSDLPVILIDTREQRPLRFTRYPSEVQGLTTGDYSVKGYESDFAVERKSLDDLAQSLTSERERFMREVDRLRGFAFARLLIIGSPAALELKAYKSRVSPQALTASLLSIEARGVPVAWAFDPERAAGQVEQWTAYFVRQQARPFRTAAELKRIVAPLWNHSPEAPAQP